MNLEHQLKDPIFKIISEVSKEEDIETFLIGGFVRDLIINRKSDQADLDFVCLGDSLILANKIANKIKGKSSGQML